MIVHHLPVFNDGCHAFGMLGFELFVLQDKRLVFLAKEHKLFHIDRSEIVVELLQSIIFLDFGHELSFKRIVVNLESMSLFSKILLSQF